MAKNIRSAYARARAVDPRPITGKESAEDLLQHAFGAYVGRQERTAYELMCRSVDEGASIFLTLSGAMTPAGLHHVITASSSVNRLCVLDDPRLHRQALSE